MENEQLYEQKLEAYKQKKAEYEMLEEPVIDDEVFKKETVEDIIMSLEGINQEPSDNARYIFDASSMIFEVHESEVFYGSETYVKQKQFERDLKDYLMQPEEKLCDFMVKKQQKLME